MPNPDISKLIRRTHLFAALFLTPWVLMYAASTIVMHHRVLFTGEQRRVAPGYELVHEEPYILREAGSGDNQAAAAQILDHLDLTGAFRVQGQTDGDSLIIRRNRPLGNYRITYQKDPGILHVERQKFSMTFVLENPAAHLPDP